MPTISMFFGIVVRMYCGTAEHNPPHIHAYYQDDSAIYNIDTLELISGGIPRRQTRLLLAWMELHKDELLADWKLASNGELPFKIDPLR